MDTLSKIKPEIENMSIPFFMLLYSQILLYISLPYSLHSRKYDFP